VERGERSPSDDFAQRCDGAFELPGTFMRLYEDLRKGAYPPFFAPVLPYEREADHISGWCLGAVPGLLQTVRYARTVIRAGRPRDDEESIQRTVDARMERQQILARPKPPMLWCVMHEGTVRHIVGNAEIMGEQLDKLVKAAETPGICTPSAPVHRERASGDRRTDLDLRASWRPDCRLHRMLRGRSAYRGTR
jgi:hypothetical protein